MTTVGDLSGKQVAQLVRAVIANRGIAGLLARGFQRDEVESGCLEYIYERARATTHIDHPAGFVRAHTGYWIIETARRSAGRPAKQSRHELRKIPTEVLTLACEALGADRRPPQADHDRFAFAYREVLRRMGEELWTVPREVFLSLVVALSRWPRRGDERPLFQRERKQLHVPHTRFKEKLLREAESLERSSDGTQPSQRQDG